MKVQFHTHLKEIESQIYYLQIPEVRGSPSLVMSEQETREQGGDRICARPLSPAGHPHPCTDAVPALLSVLTVCYTLLASAFPDLT